MGSLPDDEYDSAGWSASKYNQLGFFTYTPAFTAPLLNLLVPKPGEHIMDFGCGTGELTMRIIDLVGEGGKVVGVDISENMVSHLQILAMRPLAPQIRPKRLKRRNQAVSSTHSSPTSKPSNSLQRQVLMKACLTPWSATLAYPGANAIHAEF
jgi:SAM-dependent methyltransferase